MRAVIWHRSRRGPRGRRGVEVTSHKVWTSSPSSASWELCLAGTDADAPRPEQGITALIVDMSDPGVDVRPWCR